MFLRFVLPGPDHNKANFAWISTGSQTAALQRAGRAVSKKSPEPTDKFYLFSIYLFSIQNKLPNAGISKIIVNTLTISSSV